MARQNKRGPDDLDSPRADGFLARERAAQRVGLVVLTVFVIAGAVRRLWQWAAEQGRRQ